MAVEYSCCNGGFFLRIGTSLFLVLFAGLMSGLTLGLMSLSLVDLEVLAQSGSSGDRKHAAKIMPVVKKQHLLLCTLLISNAAAMEALPIFLDSLVPSWVAILLSVTLILLFGEIIPQAVCSRHGLAIGAKMAPVVRILVWICFPIAYPISKLLDYLLGKGHDALFRRAELKTLVDLHSNKAGKGGELTNDETTIIAGALDLAEKKAGDAMTPISGTFAIDVNARLDRELMKVILDKGHSRVPVYYRQTRNIIGLILVKNLLTINPDDGIPVKDATLRKIPRVPETMPLYDMLNEFQKGHSHMAVVVAQHRGSEQTPQSDRDVRLDVDAEMHPLGRCLRSKSSLCKASSLDASTRKSQSKGSRDFHPEILHINGKSIPEATEVDEAIGIITLEDVIEELLQEEIYDETDHRVENGDQMMKEDATQM